ncbi:MAG: hypothetical protein H7Z42_02430, partial [Roseiflexaceae bacterium]|nr:hypothetical protein [Roseiflexaceae bacterium]
ELSTDQGRSWHTADMTSADAVGSWCLWRAQLDITNVTTSIIVRAWDTAANSQPALVEQVWNAKGYMNNAWHRVPVIVAGAQ